MAGEQPWCDDDSAPREAYRLVWGLPQLPVVATVRIEGDSARVHVFAAEIQDSVGYVYPARDTTYVVPRSWITVTILGEDWRPGEPSSSGFNATLWKSEHIDPQPAGGQRPILELESILHGRYHASVRWNAVSLLDPFGRTAYELAKLGIADQHIFVQDPHARRT